MIQIIIIININPVYLVGNEGDTVTYTGYEINVSTKSVFVS